MAAWEDESGDGATEGHWEWPTDPVENERDAEESKPVQREVVEEQLTDRQKKQRALAACSVEHAKLYTCLRKGIFADCDNARKAFWNCYAEHRGVNENKVSAWFNSLKMFKRDRDSPQSSKNKETRASIRTDDLDDFGAPAESK